MLCLAADAPGGTISSSGLPIVSIKRPVRGTLDPAAVGAIAAPIHTHAYRRGQLVLLTLPTIEWARAITTLVRPAGALSDHAGSEQVSCSADN